MDGSCAQRVAAIRLTLAPTGELEMVRNFTTALVAALMLGSVGIASARVFAPGIEHYDAYPQSEEPYCYLPSWPCEQPAPHNHR